MKDNEEKEATKSKDEIISELMERVGNLELKSRKSLNRVVDRVQDRLAFIAMHKGNPIVEWKQIEADNNTAIGMMGSDLKITVITEDIDGKRSAFDIPFKMFTGTLPRVQVKILSERVVLRIENERGKGGGGIQTVFNQETGKIIGEREFDVTFRDATATVFINEGDHKGRTMDINSNYLNP